jgi:hypothetical protein
MDVSDMPTQARTMAGFIEIGEPEIRTKFLLIYP